jgi:prophage regulatory protein
MYALMRVGDFPAAVPLGPRAVAWVESEIEIWIEDRIRARQSRRGA